MRMPTIKRLKFVAGVVTYLFFILREIPWVYGWVIENKWNNIFLINSFACFLVIVICFPFVLMNKRYVLSVMCSATFLSGAIPLGGVLLGDGVVSVPVLSFGLTYIVYAILFFLFFSGVTQKQVS